MNWVVGIYLFIGLILSGYFWNKDYSVEYEKAKAKNEVEKGMVPILFILLIIFWPIKLFWRLRKNETK